MIDRAAGAAALLLAVAVLNACGGGQAGAPQPPPPPLSDQLLGEQLVLPPVPYEMFQLKERLHAAFGDSADFGDGAVNDDRTQLTIRWHGQPPGALLEIIADYADADFDIVIEATDFRPGDLRAEASRLVREHYPVVQGAGPRPAGDGVAVTLSTAAVQAAGSVEAALAANRIVSDYPLFPEVGDITPA